MRRHNNAGEQIQHDYYAKTASSYNTQHIDNSILSGHNLSLSLLRGILCDSNSTTLLDVGAGTGRTLCYFKNAAPEVSLLGIEPVEAMRRIGYSCGLTNQELIEGSGYDLPLPGNSIDIVSIFGVLHHVSEPERVISEMFRVAKKGVFISDGNNNAQGSMPARTVKMLLRITKLWRPYVWLKTRGKMYEISAGDGLYYPYSLFQNYKHIQSLSNNIYLLNTGGSAIFPIATASSVAIYAEKRTG